jgi:transcriptional antiterminator RfaH
MIGADEPDAIRWYAIHTKPKQELRASCNLQAWGVENFAPCVKERRYNHYSGKVEHVTEPLFTNYIFARFTSGMLSKIRFTRGVRNVVSFAGVAIPIDDEIIYLIQSQMEHGFVKLDTDLKRGDELRVQCGALEGLRGIFDRRTRSATRVLMLLKTVNYQAYAEVEELQVRKVG